MYLKSPWPSRPHLSSTAVRRQGIESVNRELAFSLTGDRGRGVSLWIQPRPNVEIIILQ